MNEPTVLLGVYWDYLKIGIITLSLPHEISTKSVEGIMEYKKKKNHLWPYAN
jgi:hypothetical protein